MSEDIAEKIKNIKNLEDFQVSLDWATKDIHDWMRWEWSFDKAMKRMKLLTNAWIKYTVSSVMHKKNLSEMTDMVNLVKNLWATFHYISIITILTLNIT